MTLLAIHRAEDPTPMLTQLLLVIFLIAANGFFVAAEFALVKVRLSQIEILADNGKWTARLTKNILEHIDAYLSACQLGITLASLALGWIGEPFVAAVLKPAFEVLGLPESTEHIIAVAVGFAVITFLHITLGEQAPKIFAIQKSTPVSLASAPLLVGFYYVFKPFIWFLNVSSNLILRVVGLNVSSSHEQSHTEEELRLILAESTAGGSLSLGERRLMENVLDLEEKIARQVMIPRRDVVLLTAEAPLEENLRLVAQSKHTRFPLCEQGLDSVVGMVHAKTLLKSLIGDSKIESLKDLSKPVQFVPESIRLDKLLKEFLNSRSHMAMVVDEYGSVSGMVTFEDVLEQLVGEIQDEFDREQPPVIALSNDHFLVKGLCPLPLLEQQCGFSVPDATSETIGGLLSAQLGRIPVKGDSLCIGGFEVEVKESSQMRVDRVELIRTQSGEPEPNEPEEAGTESS